MKKGHGLERALDVIERSDLAPMATGALLARLTRLRWCEDGPESSDLLPHEVEKAKDKILFKNDPRWKAAYADLKAVLATREHHERKIG